MAKIIKDTMVVTFSFSVRDIENCKDSILSMIRSFRVMHKVTKNMWNNIVDQIIHEEYESSIKHTSVLDFFDNRISVKSDPTFRRSMIVDGKIDNTTQDDVFYFFSASKTIQ